MKVFASSMWEDANIEGTPVTVEGSDTPAILHPDGLLFTGSDGQKVKYLWDVT